MAQKEFFASLLAANIDHDCSGKVVAYSINKDTCVLAVISNLEMRLYREISFLSGKRIVILGASGKFLKVIHDDVLLGIPKNGILKLSAADHVDCL